MSNSHSLSFMVMPAERHFGEGKPPLRKIKKGEDEEVKCSAHLTCSALWEEQ